MKDDFIKLFSTLTKASARVLWVPTKEAYRAADSLREHAHHNKMPYKEWDCVHGWREFKAGSQPPTTGDGQTDLFMAMQVIDDVSGGYQKSWKEGVFVMHYPHWMLKKEMTHFGVVQLLKQYARSFAASKQRLVLIVPDGFTPPAELENEIATCEMNLPSQVELRELLLGLVEGTGKGSLVPWIKDEASINAVLNAGTGLTEAEFRLAAGRAMVENKETWPNTPLNSFLQVVMAAKTDVVKRSEVLSIMKSGSLEQIGGLENLKQWLVDAAEYRNAGAAEFGINPPKGISLIGPPGTGKSLTAMAAASILRLPLIRVDIGACFNSLIGESEARLRDALRLLKALAPCVAFVDEVDKALGGAHQAAGDGGVTKRILGYILEFMSQNTDIFFMFTANRTEGLDSALLRKGRLDEVFSVMPPNQTERLEIFKIHLRARKQDDTKVHGLEAAVQRSEGFVAAELEAAVESAVRIAWKAKQRVVTGQHIVDALADIKPISEAFADDFNAMTRWAAQNARPASRPDAEKQVKTPPPRPGVGRARIQVTEDD